MKRTKLIDYLIVLLNVVGISCLLYYGWFYIIHDHSTVNPNAMLAVERWDASGMILTIGLIPLIIVNVIAFRRFHTKYKFSCLIPSLVCVSLVGHYWMYSLLNIHNEVASKEVVKIAYQEKDETTHYGRLYDDGGLETIEAFPFDDVAHEEFDHSCFESIISDNKVINKLNSDVNKQIDDPLIMHLLELVVKDVDHDISQIDIYNDDQAYFVSVKINVNWQDPVFFYQYIDENDQLKCLYQWDGIDIIGMAL